LAAALAGARTLALQVCSARIERGEVVVATVRSGWLAGSAFSPMARAFSESGSAAAKNQAAPTATRRPPCEDVSERVEPEKPRQMAGRVRGAAYRLAAAFIDAILKGAKSSRDADGATHEVELILNLKPAKTLGLTIPPTLLGSRQRGDRVRCGRPAQPIFGIGSKGLAICFVAAPKRRSGKNSVSEV